MCTATKHFKTLNFVETFRMPTIHPEAFDHLSHADKLAYEEAEEEPGDDVEAVDEAEREEEAPSVVKDGQMKEEG